jgi:cobalt-zinc-cadmium efflux system outer membrane protein
MKRCIWFAIVLGITLPTSADDGRISKEGILASITAGHPAVVVLTEHPASAESERSAADTTTQQSKPAAAVREPTGSLTLAEALALALTENPELAPFAWHERADEARIIQASLRINPELNLQVEDVLGTGAYSGGSQAQTTLQLSQVIELGGKRAARREVASRARGITQFEYESVRVDVLANVTQRFIHVVAKQQSLELAITNHRLAEDALTTVQKRVEAGKASALEATKAQVALARGEVLVGATRNALNAARKLLAASWRNDDPVFERAEADLFARRPIPPYQALAGQISSSPEIARWISEKRLREAEIKLADALRVPNLTVGGGIRLLEGNGEEALVFGLTMPLPLFDRNQGGSAELRAEFGRAEADQKAAEFRIGAVLLGLYEETVHNIHVIEGLERKILPMAEEALAISREGYVQGRFSYLEVLDAQRTVFDVRQEYIRMATSYHQLLVEIERLTGQPFEGGELHR